MYSRRQVAGKEVPIPGNKLIHHSRDVACPTKLRFLRAHHTLTLSIGIDMPAIVPLDSTYGVMLVGTMFAIW